MLPTVIHLYFFQESDHFIKLFSAALVERRWGQTATRDPTQLSAPVVNFQDPEQLRKILDAAGGVSITKEGLDSQSDGDAVMAKMFEAFQDNSVNTSHPLFVNQLFGMLDRASLSAEILGASENTSSYTYEAAPVYLLLEREVMGVFAGLLGWTLDDSEGLMLPGGSMGNLFGLHCARHKLFPDTLKKGNYILGEKPRIFISAEAHYSFLKTCGVLGFGRECVIKVDTDEKGAMDCKKLDAAIAASIKEGCKPFFIGATAGSTVKGTFDPFTEVAAVAKKYNMWFHIDGAWGGSALFSTRPEMKALMKGSELSDSFTMNPHKMLGAPLQTTAFITRNKGLLLGVNSSKAKYLFDPRKAHAHLDIGDQTFMCGRKMDSIKFWSLLRFRGLDGINNRVNHYNDCIMELADRVRKHPNFMLGCDPWPFNVNFYYLPKRIRSMLEAAGVKTDGSTFSIPDEISAELDKVSVALKIRMQKAGKALVPFQPLAGQKAQLFRIVLSGSKDDFGKLEMETLMNLMIEYGDDL